ncbi:unnamed protein product [Xylocopa violacea]|uniref:Transmembrane protein n=1 Tax=Xylocopa violacea TaxID=135666 RepID=A0ABP1P295_XYLVO
MYESVVLEKRKPRTIAGTPAAKLLAFKNCMIIAVPIGGMFLLSNFIIKRRKIICELDEHDPRVQKIRLVVESMDTMLFWNRPDFRGIVGHILERYNKNTELFKNIPLK